MNAEVVMIGRVMYDFITGYSAPKLIVKRKHSRFEIMHLTLYYQTLRFRGNTRLNLGFSEELDFA